MWIAKARQRSALLRDFAEDEDVEAQADLPEHAVNVWMRYSLAGDFESSVESVTSTSCSYRELEVTLDTTS